MEGLPKNIGLPDFLRISLKFLKEIPDKLVSRKGGYIQPNRQPMQTTLGYPQYSGYSSGTVNKAATDFSRYASGNFSQSTPKNILELKKGDMVTHTAFGKGMVLSVLKIGNDALWEVAFDNIGTKKLMAKTASAHMKRL